METVNQRSLDGAQKALAAHTEWLLLEGGPDVQLWHLLISLQEYCGANGIDFNEQLNSTREQLSDGEIVSPAWKRALSSWAKL